MTYCVFRSTGTGGAESLDQLTPASRSANLAHAQPRDSFSRIADLPFLSTSGVSMPNEFLVRPRENGTFDDICILKTSALRCLASTFTSWKSRWLAERVRAIIGENPQSGHLFLNDSLPAGSETGG
jgi:hypothetical protein